MRNVSQLTTWRDAARASLKTAARVREQFDADMARLEADRPNRSAEFMQTAVRALRDRYMSELGKPAGDVRQNAANIVADQWRWQSLPYQLAQQRFDADPAADAAARSHLAARLALLPDRLLKMELEAARRMATDTKAEKDLAALHVVACVLEKATGKPAELRGIEIPAQVAALSVIGEAHALIGEADELMAQVSGRSKSRDGADLLTSARARIAPELQPTMSCDVPGALPRADDGHRDDELSDSTPQERINALREPA